MNGAKNSRHVIASSFTMRPCGSGRFSQHQRNSCHRSGQVSLAGQTVTVSGNIQQDSPTGPAYVSNPNGFYFTVTDGITTVSGQERRNSDPMGGPNKALQSIATFDGSQSTQPSQARSTPLVSVLGRRVSPSESV